MSEIIIKHEDLGELIKIFVSGELDIYNVQKFKEQVYEIIDMSMKDIKIDCNNLTYVDSTGLGVFVGALKKAKQNEVKIIIINLKENIKKLFVITGLDKVFNIEE